MRRHPHPADRDIVNGNHRADGTAGAPRPLRRRSPSGARQRRTPEGSPTGSRDRPQARNRRSPGRSAPSCLPHSASSPSSSRGGRNQKSERRPRDAASRRRVLGREIVCEGVHRGSCTWRSAGRCLDRTASPWGRQAASATDGFHMSRRSALSRSHATESSRSNSTSARDSAAFRASRGPARAVVADEPAQLVGRIDHGFSVTPPRYGLLMGTAERAAAIARRARSARAAARRRRVHGVRTGPDKSHEHGDP